MIDLSKARALIKKDGATYGYLGVAGLDLGDFYSPIGKFTQRNVIVKGVVCPLNVFFRPDRESDRWEVVFELGMAFPTAPPANYGPYTAEIWLDTTMLYTQDVPIHYWNSRWRWQSAVRPIVRPVQQVEAGLLPPYRDVQKKTSPVPPKPTPPTIPTPLPTPVPPTSQQVGIAYPPMDLAGVTAYMPQTGERNDIGLVTGVQGNFIDDQAQLNYWDTVIAQAEASAAIPWHLRGSDSNMLSQLTWPNATTYADKSYWNYIPGTSNPVTIDAAHCPDLCYLPYLLTGDPYYLEELQFAANMMAFIQPPDMRTTIVQTRAFAWTVRMVGQCAAVTPDLLPGWLLSKTYWQTILEGYRVSIEKYVTDTANPVRAVLRTADDYASSRDEGPTNPAGTHTAPWQDEFMACVFGWLVDMGHYSWQPIFDWQIGSTISRTSGTSGWNRSYCTPYRLNVCVAAGAPLAQDWSQAYSISSSLQGWPTPPGDILASFDPAYIGYTNGALVYAEKAGYAVFKQRKWLQDQMAANAIVPPNKWKLVPA